jgi:release factor glutamine methyltransferase
LRQSFNIGALITESSLDLANAGVSEPRLTASLLLGHVIGRDRAYLFIHPEEIVSPERIDEYRSLIERRVAGEPLQYITGHQEFYGLDFIVTPAVLIPRPETEFIIDQVLKLSANSTMAEPRGGQALIMDIGTGSGCIAVTVAVKLRWTRVLALDISQSAIDIATINARNHGVDTRIDFIQSDLFVALLGREPRPQADFILSNPPYISLEEKDSLQREVRDHEPHSALFAAGDGLEFYRRLFIESKPFLKNDGKLICEIGINQLPQIESIAHDDGWVLEEITHDLQDIPRTLTLRMRR